MRNLQKEAGRIVANPFADPKRFHKAQHEDYYNALSSLDEIEFQDGEAVAGTLLGIKIVTAAGVAKTITFDAAVDQTDAAACTAAIAAAMAEEGEINQVISYEYRATGTLIQFRHVGIMRITALTFTTTGDVSTTHKTTPSVRTRFVGFFVGAEIVTINGRAFAGANAPYAWSGTPATDAATAADIVTDLATHEVTADEWIGVNVRVDTVAEKYEVNIFTKNNIGVKANGETLAIAKQEPIFVA